MVNGSSAWTVVRKVLLPEAMPALVSGTVTAIALVGSAIAGVIGAGGLGNLAYLTGFTRNQNDVICFNCIYFNYRIYNSIYWGLDYK